MVCHLVWFIFAENVKLSKVEVGGRIACKAQVRRIVQGRKSSLVCRDLGHTADNDTRYGLVLHKLWDGGRKCYCIAVVAI